MFVERLFSYSALLTYLLGCLASAVSLPPASIIFAQLAYPLNDMIFCLHKE
jgi:hypothetical protein